jgi:predicted nucleic acid-binding protein
MPGNFDVYTLWICREEEKWRELAQLIPSLPVPAVTSEKYGSSSMEQKGAGPIIGNHASWIAARTGCRLILMTTDEREFLRLRAQKIRN